MLSVASVSSASGASEYFARDDYYTTGETGMYSEWGGKGAEALGLEGEVTKEKFEAALNGKLPDGTQVGDPDKRRIGMDMTFSMPKSASVIGYVTGDKRILILHREAVKETMKWAEKKLAQTRTYENNHKGEAVNTGKLIYAMFEHDTSRAMDPQGHIHTVIANMTQKSDGTWQALHNDQLWKNNSLIGAAYHANFREKLEEAGYQTKVTGKHGQFEIEGVPSAVIKNFSQRRQDIVRQAEIRGQTSPQAMRAITKTTRDKKMHNVDRASLIAEWRARAVKMGWDGKDLFNNALKRVRSIGQQSRGGLRETIGRLKHTLTAHQDPLVDRKAWLGKGGSLAVQEATASAVRHLSEREAVFSRAELLKETLESGKLGVKVEAAEARIDRLAESGYLIPEQTQKPGEPAQRYTTREELQREQAIVKSVDQGKGAAIPIVAADQIGQRMQVHSKLELLPEQIGAGALAMSSEDKIVAIQGRAGAGKSTMLSSLSRVAEEEGKRVLGLAVQNKMVLDLKEGAQIEGQSISAFINRNIKEALSGQDSDTLKNTLLVVDESSMVSSKQMLDLMTIADKLGAERLVFVGDRNQLLPVEAGKSFAVIQDQTATTALMNTNLRQQTPQLRAVADLIGKGYGALALKTLGGKVKEAEEPSVTAAMTWLSLSKENRDQTALLASGREAREIMNMTVQQGLLKDGTLENKSSKIETIRDNNATREKLRNPLTYEAGKILDAAANVRELNLKKGRYEIAETSTKGVVTLKQGGRITKIRPDRIKPDGKNIAIKIGDKKEIQIHEGEIIRWNGNDTKRGLNGSALAKILSITENDITVRNAQGETITMSKSDPMLGKIDLGYTLNAHMAQGITCEKVIATMDSREKFLSNERLFNVTLTRTKHDITLFTDDAGKLGTAIARNDGDKTSAIESVSGENQKPRTLVTGGTSGFSASKTQPNSEGIRASERKAAMDSLRSGLTDTARPSPEPVKDVQKTLDLNL